ncbi:MAG TPA: Ig-like domain-containing protein [Gemmatimonadaceae bacterium]|nr:Ig-like domain-containing protein [Gemmatimonadaceae bacterium]
MRTFMLAVTGIVFSVAACSSYGTSVVASEQTKAQVASVSLQVPTSLIAGQSARGSAVPRDANGNPLTDRPVTWYSSSGSVASVDDSGMISAIAPGTAVVSAVSEGVSGQASMAVTPPPPTPIATLAVAINPSAVLVGQTARATVTALDSTGHELTGRTITWTSDNVSIATVDATGDIKAIGAGAANIKASSEGKTSSARLSVSAPAPIPVATVSVSPTTANLQVGGTVQLSAVTRDANNNVLTGRAISWSSAAASIATVSASGLVTAVGAGTVAITASSEGQTGSSNITVSAPAPVPVASVSVSPTTANLQVGGTVQLSAVTRDANNNVLTGRVIAWSSSNSAVSTVSGSGLVTAIASGSATITASSEGRSGSSSITVSTPAPVPVASVSVSPASANLQVGGTVQLSAVTRDANNNVLTGRVVAWSSSNAAVSSVSSTGLVTALAAGTATITATSENQVGSSVITSTASTGGAPSTCGNEPSGMTRISERPFSSMNENSAWDTDNTLSIFSDGTAPMSPSSVLRATYPAGWPAGAEPGHTGLTHQAYAKIYICFALKLSSNWVGNGSGTNKVMYEWTVNPNKPAFFFSAQGIGNGTLAPWARLQDIVTFPGGSGNLAPNLVPSAQIIRGRWHQVEVYLQGNTSGSANGTIDWYLDGVHIGSVGGVGFSSGAATFYIFEFRPVWGGTETSPAITSTQTMDWDHVYISGKN